MILKAEKGYRYTNGIAFGKVVALPETANANEWYLITEKQYQEIKKAQRERLEDEE